MRRLTTALILAALLALALVGRAEAHANLLRSSIAPGATLDAAPAELVLEFSERLDPSFTRVQLFNSANQVVNAGPGTIDPGSPRTLRLPLGELPRDSYTAVWRALSLDDGHTSEGNVPFGVGVAARAGSLVPPPGAPDPATVPPAPLDSAARWLNLLAVALMLGGLPFALFVWRPAIRRAAGDDLSQADDRITRAIRRLVIVGGGAFLLTNLLFLLVRAAAAADVALVAALGSPLLQLLGGRLGQLGLARWALAVVLMAIAWRLPPAGRGPAWPWWLGLLIGAGLLLTFSMSGHGAALVEGAGLAIALDWLHVAATVAWLGGLVPLALVIRDERRMANDHRPPATENERRAADRDGPRSSLVTLHSSLLPLLVPRFSALALVCVAVLGFTGLYSAYIHIGSLDLLVATTYGRVLLVKTGLFGLLLLLGAVNLLALSPRLRRLGGQLGGAFGRTVRAELAIGALLLLAVGALTSVAPSAVAWQEKERQGIAQEVTVGDVDLVLRVAPAWIGDNEFAVDVADRRPGAQDAASKLLLRFDMVGMEMGELQTEAASADAQRYTARGSYVSMGGRWNVEVVLRRAGFDDVRHTFEVDILRSATPNVMSEREGSREGDVLP